MTRHLRAPDVLAIFSLFILLGACGQVGVEDPAPQLEPEPQPPTAIEWLATPVGYEAPAVLVPSERQNPLVVQGSGEDIWYDRDGFFFVYTELEGDGYIEARLASFDAPHEWSKGGLMFREDLDPGSRNVLLHTSRDNGAVLQARESTGGLTNNLGGKDETARPGEWMRLSRSGDQITGWMSQDGEAWRQVGSYDVALNARVLVGLAVTSHLDGEVATATFTDLALDPDRAAPDAPATPTTPESEPALEPEVPSQPDSSVSVPDSGFELPPATLYVAPNGSDDNSGRSIDVPLRTITRAAQIVEPGDVVYLRGGTYPIKVRFTRSGTEDRPIVWASYPGERAVLDGSGLEPGVSMDRVWVDGASWNVFTGFEVRNGPRQGIFLIDASDNRFHGIVTHGHHGSGIQNYSGDRNRFEYVIAYDNYDEFHAGGRSGEDADGIGLSSGEGHVLYRVVTFDNSDDGIDAWKSTHTLIDGAVSYGNGRGDYGNGNGIKAGGGIDNYTTVRNSLAFHNRASGIDHNMGRHMWFYNNTSFGNGGPAFVANDSVVLRNNIGIGSRLSLGGADASHNDWDLGIPDVGFVSTDPNDTGFLSLRADSMAIDVGVDVGLAFEGTAPDLGALPFEVTLGDVLDPSGVQLASSDALRVETLASVGVR